MYRFDWKSSLSYLSDDLTTYTACSPQKFVQVLTYKKLFHSYSFDLRWFWWRQRRVTNILYSFFITNSIIKARQVVALNWSFFHKLKKKISLDSVLLLSFLFKGFYVIKIYNCFYHFEERIQTKKYLYQLWTFSSSILFMPIRPRGKDIRDMASLVVIGFFWRGS